MKKLSVLALGLIFAGSAIFTACSGKGEQPAEKSDSTNTKAAKTEQKADSGFAPTTNIRFIDEERLLEEYNLAKDYKETTMRTISRLQSAQQSKAQELQQLEQSMQTKYQNGGFKSQAELDAAGGQLQKKQQEAQSYIANLQQNAEAEDIRLKSQMMDSIQSYIKIYNETRHYDAILLKSAGLYFNPALDITEEIVKGLNERYNKKQ